MYFIAVVNHDIPYQ